MEDNQIATVHMGSEVIASGLETAFSNVGPFHREFENVRKTGLKAKPISVQPKRISPSHVFVRNPFSLIDG